MGIKASDDLFQLIQTLSPAEKRAFKLISDRHARQDGNNYLQLFDAIAAQTQYDEAALRKQFEGKAFLKNFSEAKAYLYRNLLRSLRFSQGPDSPEAELREMLDHLAILHAKGLNEQAERQVKMGLSKAHNLDLHAFSAEFHKWQRRLAKRHGNKGLRQELEGFGAEEDLALSHLRTEAHLRDLMGRIQVMLVQKSDLSDPAQSQALDQIWCDPVLHTPPLLAGFHALSSYFHAHAYFHQLKSQLGECAASWKAVVGTFEDFPIQIKHQPDQYINALVALLDVRLSLRQFDFFREEMAKLKAQHSSEMGLVARIFLRGNHLSMRHALITGQFEEAIRNLPELETGMVKYKKYMSVSLEMSLLFNICSLFFLGERYPEAQRHINTVLNRPHLPIREDLVDALRMLEMVARYARGQTDLLEHLLKAQERRLRQANPKPIFLSLVVRALSGLMNATDAPETKVILHDLLVELEAMPSELRIAGHEELLWWTRSRVEGKPIALLLQRSTTEGH